MRYQLVGYSCFKCDTQDTGLNLEVDLQFEAKDDDEAMAKVNQVLTENRYTILPDGTLSPTISYQWLRVQLYEVRHITQIERRKASLAGEILPGAG